MTGNLGNLSENDERLRDHLKDYFTPIDNVPRDHDEEGRIIEEQQSAMVLYNQLATPLAESIFRDWFEFEYSQRDHLYREIAGRFGIPTPAALFNYCAQRSDVSVRTPADVFNTFGEDAVGRYNAFKSYRRENFAPVPKVSITNIEDRLREITVIRPHQSRLWRFNKTYVEWQLSSLREREKRRPWGGVEIIEEFVDGSKDVHLGSTGENGPDMRVGFSPTEYYEDLPLLSSLQDGQESWNLDLDEACYPPLFFPRNEHGCYSRGSAARKYLEFFVKNHDRRLPLCQEFEKPRGKERHVFSFQDRFNRVFQKVIRTYDSRDGAKLLVPCVYRSASLKNLCDYYCLPLPGKQPLFNENLLYNSEQGHKDIILTDTVELAAVNDMHPNANVIYSGWYGGEESFPYIDLTPLKNREGNVYFLVSNHSGIDLDDACLNAEYLASYIEEEDKEFELRFVVMFVDYGSDDEPVANSENAMFFTPAEFIDHCESIRKEQERLQGAIQTLRRGRIPELNETASEPMLEESSGGSKSPSMPHLNWLFRPLIAEGGSLTLLHAEPNAGKTSFALSLSAALISNSNEYRDLVRGQWWIPSYRARRNSSVMYFDFEPHGGNLGTKAMTCMNPYLTKKQQVEDVSDNALSRKKSGKPPRTTKDSHVLDNASFPSEFVPVKLRSSRQGLKDGETQQEIMDYIERFKDRDPPLRVAVFDNFFSMVGFPEQEGDWKMVNDMFLEIMAKGISILLVHHTNDKGGAGGYKTKEQDCRMIGIMKKPETKIDEKSASLRDPVTLSLEMNEDLLEVDREPVCMHVPVGDDEAEEDNPRDSKPRKRNSYRWTVYDLPCRESKDNLNKDLTWEEQLEEDLADRALWRFARARDELLKSQGNYQRDDIADILGYDKTAYYKHRDALKVEVAEDEDEDEDKTRRGRIIRKFGWCPELETQQN